MLRQCVLLGLLAGSAGGQAQTLYKCSAGGKVTYASAPCDGAVVAIIATPAPPPPDPGAGQEREREAALLAKLGKERAAREARDLRQQRAAGRRARAAAKYQQRCARLALRKRWADQDASRAAGFDKEALQQKARRMGEAMAVECPD